MSDLSPANAAILDYASPRRRASFAMNAKSVIRVMPAADGIDIVESLVEQRQAMGAIIFTSCSIGLMGLMMLGIIKWPAQLRDVLLVLAIYGPIVTGTACLIVAVIHSNWKKTILEVRHDQFSLVFSSPIRTQYYDWHSSQIRRVAVTNELYKGHLIYEIQIEIGTEPVLRLFTGHPQSELASIASRIAAIVSGTKMAQPL